MSCVPSPPPLLPLHQVGKLRQAAAGSTALLSRSSTPVQGIVGAVVARGGGGGLGCSEGCWGRGWEMEDLAVRGWGRGGGMLCARGQAVQVAPAPSLASAWAEQRMLLPRGPAEEEAAAAPGGHGVSLCPAGAGHCPGAVPGCWGQGAPAGWSGAAGGLCPLPTHASMLGRGKAWGLPAHRPQGNAVRCP